MPPASPRAFLAPLDPWIRSGMPTCPCGISSPSDCCNVHSSAGHCRRTIYIQAFRSLHSANRIPPEVVFVHGEVLEAEALHREVGQVAILMALHREVGQEAILEALHREVGQRWADPKQELFR